MPDVNDRIYYPGRRDDWDRREPKDVGMDATRLAEAIRFHEANESKSVPRGDAIFINQAVEKASEPYNSIIGPMKPRGPANGLVLRHGYIVAEWGDTRRVDMTFSHTKSYVSTTAGLAVDDGLIGSVHDPVRDYVTDGGFDSPHNSKITWHMLLNQTSEWEGTIWGKPDWCDRPVKEMHERQLVEPGTRWKYNDARVNRLALCLLRVWRRPLPQVLRERVMDPIGASHTWEWHGYENSWVTIDGAHVQSISGGGHWGGGMWIATRDQARFGYLCLRKGKWGDRVIISENWIRQALTPTPQMLTYGYMNWHPNTNRQAIPSAPETSYYHAGKGMNVTYVDPEHDLVVAARWIENSAFDGFIRLILASVVR